MPSSFWTGYLLKLAIVAVALGALYLLGRRLRRTKLFAPANRCLQVIESVMLSPHAGVYVVRAGTRYFLLGVGSGGVTPLAELTSGEVAPEPRR